MPKNKKVSGFSAFCLGIVLIALLIQAGGAFHDNRIVFPDVRDIGKAFLRLLLRGETYRYAGVTLLHLAEALSIAMVIGIMAGLAEGLTDFFHTGFKPLMIMIRSLPMIILVILMMTVMPYRRVPVAAGAVVLIPLISEAVCEGCRAIEPELTDVYRLNSSFSIHVLFRVYIPLISGYLKQAFFNAAGMGLKVVVSAEYLVQTRDSLGKAVYSSSYFLEYAEIYAYALIMVFLVLMITELPVILLKTVEKASTGKQNSRRLHNA